MPLGGGSQADLSVGNRKSMQPCKVDILAFLIKTNDFKYEEKREPSPRAHLIARLLYLELKFTP
jgi:hypothetical protein